MEIQEKFGLGFIIVISVFFIVYYIWYKIKDRQIMREYQNGTD